MSVAIKQVIKRSAKIKSFEENEWYLADLEHYGKARPFSKKPYKFTAVENDTVLGVLDLIIEGNVAYIENLVISSKHRGEGIGRRLLTYGEQFAKKENCTKIWLDTEEAWGAEKFYTKMGYKITGVHEKHFLGKKGLIFTKFLP